MNIRVVLYSVAKSVVFALLCLGVSVLASAEPSLPTAPMKIVVPMWANSTKQGEYFVRLLKLAFEKTEATEGVVDLQASKENFSGTRYLADLKNNTTIDVIWHGTNPQRERDLLPIRISLLKNLNEYRLLLIRAEDQEKFNQVQTLTDLSHLTAGAGTDWPSLGVMRSNGLPVMSVNNSSLLFGMLKSKRIDYMSRNVFEIWGEAEQNRNNNLVVESHIMLNGGVPFYFFVNKSRITLANRIERGLTMAIADGSFEALFLSVPDFKRGTDEIANRNRLMLELNVIFPELP